MLPRTCYRGKKTTPVATLSYIQHSGDTAAKTDAGDKYTGLDRFGRVIDQVWRSVAGSVTIMDRYQYGYDRAGNRLFKNNLLDTALSELYGYDNLNQTTSFSRGVLSDANSDGLFDTVASPSRTQAWNLDALGNWSTFTTNSTSQSRSHNAQNQLTAVGSTTLSYDANGSMTADESGRIFVYDAWNRLAAVRNTANSPIVGYSYDALGRRIIEDRPNANTVDHLYYSTAWQVLEERRDGTSSGDVRRQYFWSIDYVDALTARVDYASGAVSATFYTQYDANWNVTAIADASTGVLERYVFDPYGVVTVLYANWTVRGGSPYGWNYLHQGGRLDVDSNLFHYRHRDYSGTLGRWTQTDPIGFDTGDLNLYRYLGNNPGNAVDPSGLEKRTLAYSTAKTPLSSSLIMKQYMNSSKLPAVKIEPAGRMACAPDKGRCFRSIMAALACMYSSCYKMYLMVIGTCSASAATGPASPWLCAGAIILASSVCSSCAIPIRDIKTNCVG